MRGERAAHSAVPDCAVAASPRDGLIRATNTANYAAFSVAGLAADRAQYSGAVLVEASRCASSYPGAMDAEVPASTS
jgi:hypothetical protein